LKRSDSIFKNSGTIRNVPFQFVTRVRRFRKKNGRKEGRKGETGGMKEENEEIMARRRTKIRSE
jgi:hypothetical protein